MSTLNVSNITDGTDTVETGYVLNGSAKVWCTINQQNTMALRDSFNVTSVTDDGTGISDLAFTSSFSNAHYAVATSSEQGGGFNDIRVTNRDSTQTRAAGQFEFYNVNGGSSTVNPSADNADYVNVIIQGDLA